MHHPKCSAQVVTEEMPHSEQAVLRDAVQHIHSSSAQSVLQSTVLHVPLPELKAESKWDHVGVPPGLDILSKDQAHHHIPEMPSSKLLELPSEHTKLNSPVMVEP